MKTSRTPESRRLCLLALCGVFVALAAALALSVVVSDALAARPRGLVYVRVNQVGYPTSGPKRAILLSSKAIRGASFSVTGSRLHGRVGRRLPRWSSRFPYAYEIDFSALRAPGRYRIAVGSARSPRFRVATPAELYGPLLGAAHAFFTAQRDGPAVDPSVLGRRPAHLNDSNASVYTPPSSAGALSAARIQPAGETVDVSGGWFDAGDYLKFAETGSFADALVLLAVRDHPAAAPLAADARFETEWLLKLWNPSSRELIQQVGLGDGNGGSVTGDHDLWRLPQADDTLGGSPNRFIRNRPAFRAGPPGAPVSPNLAGRLAADYALCAQVFRASDEQLASRCLVSAQSIYDQARTTNGALTTAAPHDYYPEVEWRDDMELGATEIYRAMTGGFMPQGLAHTDPGFYLHSAAHWASEYMRSPNADADSLNLYDVTGVAHPELIAALDQAVAGGQDPADLQVSRAELLGDLHSQLAAGQRHAAADSFGLANPFGVADSVPHALGYAIEARGYDAAAGRTAFGRLGARELDWVLGENAWGSSFVVGAGSTFPHCLQHQVANLSGSLTGHGRILAGAVVDGPNDASAFAGLQRPDGARACPRGGSANPFGAFDSRNARYIDSVDSDASSEPTIDYTSLAALAFAGST